MSIDAGDRLVEYKIKERERVGRYMYDHQEDYVSRSRYEKTVDQLTKAKELLLELYDCIPSSMADSCKETLQKVALFFKDSEVEK